jgi:hypothetical protein
VTVNGDTHQPSSSGVLNTGAGNVLPIVGDTDEPFASRALLLPPEEALVMMDAVQEPLISAEVPENVATVAMSDISGSFRSDSSRPSKWKPSTLEISNAYQG